MFNDEIISIFTEAAKTLVDKGHQYGDSWKKRGGVGAFMMLARKWDRIERAAQVFHWDIFVALEESKNYDLMDDIQDLRNYLTLVEHEIAYVQGEGDYGRHREGNSETSAAADREESSRALAEELGMGPPSIAHRAR